MFPNSLIWGVGWWIKEKIKTAISIENANLSKTGFQENFHTRVSTDHQVQFFNGFNQPTHGDGDGDGDNENFFIGKCCENEMT